MPKFCHMFATVLVFCDLKHTKTWLNFKFLRLNQTWERLYDHEGSNSNNFLVSSFSVKSQTNFWKIHPCKFHEYLFNFCPKPKIFYDPNSPFEMIFPRRLYLRVVQTEVDITFEIHVGKKRIRHSTNFEILCLRLLSELPKKMFRG